MVGLLVARKGAIEYLNIAQSRANRGRNKYREEISLLPFTLIVLVTLIRCVGLIENVLTSSSYSRRLT